MKKIIRLASYGFLHVLTLSLGLSLGFAISFDIQGGQFAQAKNLPPRRVYGELVKLIQAFFNSQKNFF